MPFHAILAKPLLIVRRRILTAAIRMMKHIPSLLLKAIRLIQSFQTKLLCHPFIHMKDDDFARAEVL